MREYTSEYYRVAHQRYLALSKEDAGGAKELAAWLDKVAAVWPRLRIESMDEPVSEIALGNALTVAINVFLDVLSPDDVAVEIITGRLNADGDIIDFFTTSMQACGQAKEKSYRFEAEIHPGSHSGLYGYALRVLPKYRELVSPFVPGLILWECGSGSLEPVSAKAAHHTAAG